MLSTGTIIDQNTQISVTFDQYQTWFKESDFLHRKKMTSLVEQEAAEGSDK